MKSSTKSIVILGYIVDDFIHYWSRIYLSAGLKCCIVDCSEEQNFRFTLPDVHEDIYTYRDVDIRCFQTPKFLNEDLRVHYDVIFYLIGSNQAGISIFKESDYRILCTNYERKNVIKVKTFIEQLDKNTDMDFIYEAYKIYRDPIGGKIKKRYVDHQFFSNHIRYVDTYELEYSEEVFSLRMVNQYNSVIKFTKIRSDFKNALKELALTVEEIEPKVFKKIYKQAERGK